VSEVSWRLAIACFFTMAGVAVIGAGTSGASSSRLPAGPRVPKSGGQVNLTAYSSSDGPNSVVILTGAIADFGTATRMSGPSGKDSELLVTVKRGSFLLNISKIEGALEASIFGKFPTNSNTCSGQVTVKGTTPVVAGSGSRAYTGLQGTFQMTVVINEVETWPSCPKTDTSPYLAQSVFTTASGTLTLR
jgi:hypothetical protein